MNQKVIRGIFFILPVRLSVIVLNRQQFEGFFSLDHAEQLRNHMLIYFTALVKIKPKYLSRDHLSKTV